jgi:di/tricarboxylate transporter
MSHPTKPVRLRDAPGAHRRFSEGAGTGFFLLAVVAALIWSRHLPLLPGLTPAASCAAILVCFTIGSWASGLFKEPITTLLFFLLAMLFSVAPAETVFAGFASPAWWLVFGGAITGIAVRTSGLAQRASDLLLSLKGGTYRHYVSAIVLASLALAFVMPSTTGRVLLLTPIALTLADRLGFSPGRRGRTGLVVAVAAACYMPPTSILPANIPNSVLLGAAQQLYDVKLHYAPYLLLHFPVLGVLKSALLIWLICRLYPDHIEAQRAPEHASLRLTPREMVLCVVLCLSLLCYATDFLHGVSPAWVSLGAGVMCLLPQTKVVSVKEFTDQMHVTPLVYVAGFLGLGTVMTESGLGRQLANLLLGATHMAPNSPLTNALLILALGAVIGALTTLPGLPAVLTPLAGQLAHSSGLPLYTVLMLQVPVFSTVFLPYQSPPMMIAMQMGGVSLREGARLCIVLAFLTILFLLPIDYAWWRLVGLLP